MVSDSSGGNTCGGDSGGPVILSIRKKQYVIGITSFGKSCDNANDGYYTSVAEYSEWITNVTGGKILPESGTVEGNTNIKLYPPQKSLDSICKNLKTISDCNNNSAICFWYGPTNNHCVAK